MTQDASLQDAVIEASRQYQKILRTLANGLTTFVSPGNQPGDRFYLRFTHKRVNGKWKVRGAHGYRTPIKSTSQLIKTP